MNAFVRAAEILRTAANDVERLQRELTLPVNADCGITEASARLRALLPEGHFLIDMSLNYWPNATPTLDWTVWDGHKSYRAPTLAGAVTSCLSANAPQADDPEEAVEAIISAVMPTKVETKVLTTV